MKAKRVLRYTGLAASILVGIWIIIALAIYFLVDVNDVKQLAQKAVKENTKGELEIGDMHLKVFPIVYFKIDGLVFKASEKFNKETIFACKESKLSFNLFSLIFGKPSITLKLIEPDLNISSDGKTNSVSDVIIPKEESSNVDVSKYLFISRIMFKIENADLKYKAPAKLYVSKGLNMTLELDPVLRSVNISTIIPIDAKEKEMSVNGQLSLSLYAHLSLSKSAKAELNIDASKLNIKTSSFHKPKGTELVLYAKIEGKEEDKVAKIEDAYVNLAGRLLQIKGSIADYSSEKPNFDLDINIKPNSVEKLIPLFTALKGAKASGNIDSKIKLKGNTKAVDVALSFDATGLDLKGEAFQKPVGVPVKLTLVGSSDLNSFDIKDLNLILVQELLNVKGTVSGFDAKEPKFNINAVTPKYDVRNFYKLKPDLAKKGIAGTFILKALVSGTSSKPVLDVNFKYEDGKNNVNLIAVSGAKSPESISAKLYSSYIDLNKYVDKEAGKTKKDKINKAAKKQDTAKTGDEPFLDKETIKSIKESVGNKKIDLSAKIDKLIFGELNVNSFVLDAHVNKDKLDINKINMNVINSTIGATFKMGLDERSPSYNGSASIKDLKATEAVGTFFPSLKGVIDGILTSDLSFNCNGYTVNSIKKTISGKGKFSFDNFRYSASDINKLLQEKVGDTLQKVGVAKEKLMIKSNPGWETVQGTFNISKEKINMEKLYGKDGEYELNGKGQLGFDERMDMYLDFIVPYKNIPYEALKVAGKEKSFLPLHMDGPAIKPRLDGPYTIKYIAEKALSYEKKKIEATVKKEAEKIKQKASQEIKKAAEPVKDKLKDAIKGLRF